MLDIIYAGRNKTMDQLIDLLQWNILKKNPILKVGGQEGMTLSRSAFAVNLSLSRHEESCSYTSLILLLDQLEMNISSEDSNLTANQINEIRTDELKSVTNIQPLIDQWESSSKMRIWLQEKKKDISNNVSKEAEQQFNQTEDTEENRGPDKAYKDANEDVEEIIDTSSKPLRANKEVQSIVIEATLREKEKQEIQNLVKKV